MADRNSNPKSEIRNPKSNNPKLQDRGHLLTEQRLPASANLDTLSTEDALRVINDQDTAIAGVVRDAIPAIAQLVDSIVERMQHGGRLIYLGAGTSGRLGVLDASECPPTFHSDPDHVLGLIAGGDSALRKSSEGMEDDPHGAAMELERIGLGERDTLVGIAAGGTTPYVRGGIRLAKHCGANTALLCCVSRAQLQLTDDEQTDIDHLIELPVGPEVVTGSTRMKAGTATKLALNMISTGAFIRLGKTWGNLMIDLRATNAKLRDRAARILVSQCDLPRDDAMQLLDRANGRVKHALVMQLKNVDYTDADALLEQHQQQLRPILGEPR